MTKEAAANHTAKCASCAALKKALLAAQNDRDDLWVALGRERERANAFFLNFGNQRKEPEPLPPPVEVPPPPPLRHRLADALNDSLKKRLPKVHQASKRAAGALRSRQA